MKKNENENENEKKNEGMKEIGVRNKG